MPITIHNPNLPAPQNAMTPRDLADIRYLVIHHTDGPVDETVAQIDQGHRNQGWAMVGYNYVIDGQGAAWSARPDNVVPAAAAGLNAVSLNVVVTGNFQPGSANFTGDPNAAQIDALKALCIDLHFKYQQISSTIGHRDAAVITNQPQNATACCGDRLYMRLGEVKQAIWDAIGH